MPIPDYQTLMKPLLCLAAEGETRVADVEGRLAAGFKLSPEERDQLLPSGRQRVLNNRIHWAKFYMQKAGLIDSPRRGRFVASEAGRHLLVTNPPKIDNELLMAIPGFAEFKNGGRVEPDGVSVAGAAALVSESQATPEEQIEAAYTALHSALRADLLARILQNSPRCRNGPTPDARRWQVGRLSPE
jgi:restriction system protein